MKSDEKQLNKPTSGIYSCRMENITRYFLTGLGNSRMQPPSKIYPSVNSQIFVLASPQSALFRLLNGNNVVLFGEMYT
jgi:hypothetical protein